MVRDQCRPHLANLIVLGGSGSALNAAAALICTVVLLWRVRRAIACRWILDNWPAGESHAVFEVYALPGDPHHA